MARIARETFPRSIQMVEAVDEDSWNVQADATQLHQVLLNLCVNARDAMPAGGTLTLSVGNEVVDEATAAMIPGGRSGSHVVLGVQDTGSGIAPEIREKIFEPFFTTKPIDQGTGLGLSTCYGIVKSHRGFITVDTEVGRGTRFKVYLPAWFEHAAPATDSSPDHLPRGNGEVVLVAEEEDAVASLAQATLEKFGYQTLRARNGAETVALYARSEPPVNLVIADMSMPVMDGVATVRALRQINRAVRLVGTSGLGANGKFADALDDADLYFLEKPFSIATLLNTVRMALDIPRDREAS